MNTGFDFLYMKFHQDNVVDMSFYQVTVAKSHKYNMKAMNAILDAFRESGQFISFVVMIFFVNHSRGKTMSLGTVTYELKTRCKMPTMYYVQWRRVSLSLKARFCDTAVCYCS